MKAIRNKGLILLSAVLLGFSPASADEGMWIPLHIQRLNQQDMQKKGLQLTAEEIYSVNNSSLKDAIVMLTGGSCTAEMISAEGLMLTNHHCAFGAIQQLSSVETDYLANGFWAKTKKDELPAQGMTASFLVRMEDVTEAVLAGLNDEMEESIRQEVIQTISDSLEKAAIGETQYDARVRSFFSGNEFYLFVYETFRDIRLAGAPPTAIGKFGGDTDNWMWPRHTGDFALCRIYTDPDGKPADYSEDNIPYKPKHHLPISLDGVKETDFAMIMGFPGRTERFLTSYGIKLALEQTQPSIVKIREKRLMLIKNDMREDKAVHLKYVSKYAQVSNYYKYFQGQMKGLKRLQVYDKKQKEERDFAEWIKKEPDRQKKYGTVLSDFESAYKETGKYQLAQTYINEAFFGIELPGIAYSAYGLYNTLSSKKQEAINRQVSQLKTSADRFFKNYNPATDQRVFAALMKMYYQDVPKELQPSYVQEAVKKYKGDFNAWAKAVYEKSIFADPEKLYDFIANPRKKVLDKDPGFQLTANCLRHFVVNVRPELGRIEERMDKANRLYIAGLREMKKDKKFYPDANSTLRLTYGQVLDYFPMDGVYYNYYTTLKGVIEKEDPNSEEFVVPDKLKELYENKDFGPYGEDGVMNINFITNNDITGGNSGSPVINRRGELIGCAFDLNWEAMTGDIAFETYYQRTISVDVRYILFIIDKFAGATHLVNEMTLVSHKDEKPTKTPPKDGSGKP